MGRRFTKRSGRRWTPVAAFLLSVAAAAGAWGQKPPTVVTARTVLAASAAHPGGNIRAAVVAEVASGYHINAHHPTLEYLIPTELELRPASHVVVKKTFYPKGRLVKFSFSDSPLSVYEGTVRVGVLLAVARGAPPGEYSLEGRLHYQACNDQACLAPASVPVAFKVKVVSRGVAVKPANQKVFSQIAFE